MSAEHRALLIDIVRFVAIDLLTQASDKMDSLAEVDQLLVHPDAPDPYHDLNQSSLDQFSVEFTDVFIS
eukprot:gene21321-25625_t